MYISKDELIKKIKEIQCDIFKITVEIQENVPGYLSDISQTGDFGRPLPWAKTSPKQKFEINLRYEV
jgi:hypothetical protein